MTLKNLHDPNTEFSAMELTLLQSSMTVSARQQSVWFFLSSFSIDIFQPYFVQAYFL